MRLRVEGSFDAATALPGHDRCAVLHGHTYRVELVLCGEESGGILVDFTEIKRILRQILEQYDHRDLSKVFDYPSCEAICAKIAEEASRQIPQFESVKVW